VLGDFGGAELSEQVDVAADERDVDFQLGEGGGDLDADEAAADDDRVACRGRRVADRCRIVEAAQGEDAFQIGTRDLKLLCLDAAGDQQLPVADSPIVIRRDDALARLDRDDGGREQEFDVVVVVKRLRLDEGVLARGLST
jgi:hypothetical protein